MEPWILAVYQKILKDNVRPSVRDLQAEANLVSAAGHDPKTPAEIHLWMAEEKQNEDFGVA